MVFVLRLKLLTLLVLGVDVVGAKRPFLTDCSRILIATLVAVQLAEEEN